MSRRTQYPCAQKRDGYRRTTKTDLGSGEQQPSTGWQLIPHHEPLSMGSEFLKG